MLDVRRLRLLRDLAHLGTIAAVAQSHAYTPSAVSQQLAALQREAGVPLLEHIGAFPSAVRTLLPPALVALGHDHPALDLRVIELDPVAMPRALRDQSLDVALLHDYDITPAGPDPTLDSVPLLDEAVFLAGPEDGTAGVTGGPLAGARHRDWIVGSPGTLCHTLAMRICQSAGFVPRVRHHADDFVAACVTALRLSTADYLRRRDGSVRDGGS
jgi:DNA-binding transcriptional LysR family regulator